MTSDNKKVILDTLVSCTLRGACNWDSITVQKALDSGKTKLRKLKPLLPTDEYQLLKDSYKTYTITGNSSPWWKKLKKLIEKYEL